MTDPYTTITTANSPTYSQGLGLGEASWPTDASRATGEGKSPEQSFMETLELCEFVLELARATEKLWATAPEQLSLLKAFSDRARDFEDPVGLAFAPDLGLDVDQRREWAKELDRGVGCNEVTERVDQALAKAQRK